ncbi:MAG: thymidylate kinase [Candidatus Methanofastidiosum sp.]|nr:thymidylate kinase [Methanofastidiosum sp.]
MSTRSSEKFLISFSGIDGAGKTTHAKYIRQVLRKHGIECDYVYGRLEPFILKPFIMIGRRIFLKERDMFKDYRGYSYGKRKKIKDHPLLFKIYYFIMLLDYLIQLFLRVKIPSVMGHNIVCDRYIFDTVINDFAVDMNYSNKKMKKEIEKFFRFFPKPTLSFFIDVPVDIAFKRKNDIPSLKYLEERAMRYRFIASEYDMIIVDGSKDLEKIKRFIKKKVSESVVRE